MKEITLFLCFTFSFTASSHKLPPEVQVIVDEAGALTGDEWRGRDIYKTSCVTCHGQEGKPLSSRKSDVPYISNQTPVYFLLTLAYFKTGHRKNPVMNNVTKNLSNQHIADLLAFSLSEKASRTHCESDRSGIPMSASTSHTTKKMQELVREVKRLAGSVTSGEILAHKKREFQTGDGRVVKIACSDCHGEKGVMDEQYRSRTLHPDLAALGTGYITHQLSAYKTGNRFGGPMAIMTRDLSNQQIADLSAYYSSIDRCSY